MIDGFAKKHLPQSEKLYKFIENLDFKTGDIFCFKSGGDGDNGELLMDYFDEWFSQSKEEEQPQIVRCKDCNKYSQPWGDEFIGICHKYSHKCTPKFYCADGERAEF